LFGRGGDAESSPSSPPASCVRISCCP
jgi:hypothetical protein